MYVWVRRCPAGELLLEAGALLLGEERSRLRVEREAGGRPWVARGNERLAVSVSHSYDAAGEIVAVAASPGGLVGIDIEPLRPVPVLGLARRWFRADEVDWLVAQDNQAEAFLLLWTAKEAVGKALGTGLRGAGLRRAVPLPEGDLSVLRPVPTATDLAVSYMSVHGFVLAVAVFGQSAPRIEIVAHDTAALSTSRSRTSLPVVVRGN